MPTRSPPTKGSYFPPNDAATYRDLWLFEERLKTTAALLQKRKQRYLLFLTQLLLVIVFLLSEVVLQTSFLALPYRWVLRSLFSKSYTEEELANVKLHPYVAIGLLLVALNTLALFFASGMYNEKIGYVPQANRALRSFNMLLNVRKPPLTSSFPFNPLAYLFPRPSPAVSTLSEANPPPPSLPESTDHDDPVVARTSVQPRKANSNASVPISPIPPSSNPRGEIIFSSRVDRPFKDGYERHRAMRDRRREEHERAEWESTWQGSIFRWLSRPWRGPVVPGSPGGPGSGIPGGGLIARTGSAGRIRPGGSRRPSPVPGRPEPFRGNAPPSAKARTGGTMDASTGLRAAALERSREENAGS